MADIYNTRLHSQRDLTMYFPGQLSPPYIMAETADQRSMFFKIGLEKKRKRAEFAIKSELTEMYAHHFKIHTVHWDLNNTTLNSYKFPT